MIEVDRGDYRDIGLDDVTESRRSAEPDLRTARSSARRSTTTAQRACRLRNKSAQCHRAPLRRFETGGQLRNRWRRCRRSARCRVCQQMRGSVGADFPASGAGDASMKATVEPLPLVPATLIRVAPAGPVPARGDRAHALEAERDGLGVWPSICQPIRKRAHLARLLITPVHRFAEQRSVVRAIVEAHDIEMVDIGALPAD